MAKYSKKASEYVKKAVRKMKKGKLTIGDSDKKVKSRKQAVAIGLSEAREKGLKVPEEKETKKKSDKKASKKRSKKKSSSKKA